MAAITPTAMDQHFGPQLPGHFDFTLLFEQYIFAMLPSAVAILTAPMYALKLLTASRHVRPGVLLWAKMAAGVSLCGLYLAEVVLWPRTEFASRYSLAASVLSLAASLCNLLIIYVGHVYYLQPSSFLSLFFSITVLLDIAVTRSLFLRGMATLGALHIAIVSVKFALVCLEEISKRYLFYSKDILESVADEATAGFWNRAVFAWLNPLLVLGFRKDLTVEDLPELDPGLDAAELFGRYQHHWRRADKTSRLALFGACLRTLFWEFSSIALPRLCFVAFSFGRPFLMQRVLDSVRLKTDSQGTVVGLIGATIIVFGGLAVSQGIYSRKNYQLKTCIRAVLIIAIYDKMQRLGMEDLSKAAAFTLMSTDVAEVEQIISLIHETWSALLELGLGIYVLYLFVGYASFLIFIPSLVSTAITFFNAKRMARARTQWNEKIEQRVAATAIILEQLKNIKATGLSGALGQFLQAKRRDEIQTSMRERRARILMFGTNAFSEAMTPVIVFAGARFWTRAATPMSAPEVFSTFAVIMITSEPLNTLLVRLTFWAGSYACITRIQKYLLLDNLDDPRECIEPSAPVVGASEKGDSEAMDGYAVTMSKVTVTSRTAKAVLSDVTLKIPKGNFILVHGKVGTGKSVFLKTILGEIRPKSGTVSVVSKEDMSFASQTPWIRNVSVKANVIGPKPFVESLYRQVIRCCALEKDIEQLPDGDETLAGSDGSNLSGGQKQRLGLARSLYVDAATVILDDVLSSLDAETSALVFERLFGPHGLLRQRKSTVVMVTNRLDLLWKADMVLEVRDDGHVKENDPLQGTSAPNTLSIREAGTSHSVSDAESASSAVQRPPPRTEGEKKGKQGQGKPASQSHRHGDFGLYSYFLRSAGLLLILFWILSVAFATVVGAMPAIFMEIWLSRDPDNDNYFAGFAIISFAVIFAISGTAGQYFLQIIPRSSTELHWRLLQAVLRQTLPFLSRTDTGTTLNRFSQDISLVSQTLPVVFAQTVFVLFYILIKIGVISAGAKYAAPIMVFLLLALYAIQYFYLKTSRQLRLMELETTSPFFSHFKETSSGIEHIRAFGWGRPLMEEFSELLRRAQKPFYYLLSVQQWLQFTLDATTCCIATILVSIATTMPGSTSDAALGLALLNLVTFSSMSSFLIRVWVSMETCLGGLARIKIFCEETPQENDGSDGQELPEEWPTAGTIEFKSVTAGYEADDGSLHKALDDATVTIKHGQKVGLAGRTGSGKSSMFMAILHMIECSGGSISIDGRDIATVPREVLRARITTLTQEGIEVRASLRYNLYPFDGPAPTEDLMVSTLDRVGLWGYITSQNAGNLDAEMSELQFSQGQKQLFFLARAVLHQATRETKIVIMDEATSSMDYEIDQRVQRIASEAFAECTVVIIAHRPHVLEGVDVVVRLESGRVITVQARSTDAQVS